MFSTSACAKRARRLKRQFSERLPARPIFRTGFGGGLRGLGGLKEFGGFKGKGKDLPRAPNSARLFRLPLILPPLHCARLEPGPGARSKSLARRSGQCSSRGRRPSKD